MGRMTRATAAAAAAVLVLGVAACGDDDDATTDTTAAETDDTSAPAEGDNAAFCDALVEFNGAVTNVELDESSTEEDVKATGEQLAPLFETIATNAPEEVSDTADELNTSIQALLDGDAEAFSSDATFETYSGFVSEAVGSCDFETVDVTAVDYAFEGVPESLEAGTFSFAFTNASETEEHEMIVLRRNDGVALSWEELLGLPEEEAMTNAQFMAAAFAPPGADGSTLAALPAGDYAMVCFIPVGGGEDGPPHFAEGMIHEFTVE